METPGGPLLPASHRPASFLTTRWGAIVLRAIS